MDPAELRQFLSLAARGAVRSDIRELLKLIARPEIISLAGGLPPPEAFPVDEVAELLPAALERWGKVALQYGPTEGDAELRKELLRWLVRVEGPAFEHLTLQNVLVTSASQQALDLCGRIFIDRDDAVVCGLPSYLGALSAFAACGAKLSGIPLDEQGLRTDLLEQRLVNLRRGGIRPKFVYAVPDFQNPAGVTLSLERRMELLAIAREFDLLVIEDSPYRQLRYVGRSQPTLFSLDEDGRVISLFTFSKMLFPGLRLGWVVADEEIISRLVVAKQPVDLCTSGLSQLLVREYLKTGRLPAQIERVREMYASKLRVLLAALEERMDPSWGVSWTRPEGGLFLWLTLPAGFDGRRLLERALERQVAFVVGKAFFCDQTGENTVRLNFSYPDEDQLRIAVERLALCIGEMHEEQSAPATAASPDAGHALLVSGEHSLQHLDWSLALHEVVE